MQFFEVPSRIFTKLKHGWEYVSISKWQKPQKSLYQNQDLGDEEEFIGLN